MLPDETSPNDIEHTRSAMGDVLTLSNLAAGWIDLSVQQVADDLADSLCQMLSLDVVNVHIAGPSRGEVAAIRSSQAIGTACNSAIESALSPLLNDDQNESLQTISNPIGAGTLRVAINRIAAGGGRCCILCGSARPDFPTEQERLLISVAANQARVALHHNQREERLREQQQQLRQYAAELEDFFDNATVGLHWVGPDGVILRVNQAELDLLGYIRDEYVGRHIADFHAHDEVISDILERLSRGEKLRDYPALLKCKDGSTRSVRIDSSVMWKDGQFVHTRCFTRDVTEVARLTAQADQQRRIYETVLSNTADFNYVFDLEGRFVYINRALLDLWGKTLEEAVGKNFFQLDYPHDLAERLQRQIQQVIETKKPVKDETPYTSATSEREYEYIFVPVLAADGSVEAVAGSTRDITDRKRLEEELRLRLDQLAAADRHKEELLASLRESERNLRLLADMIPQLAWMARSDGYISWYNQRWYEYTGTTPEQMEGWGWQSVHDPSVLPEVMEQWERSIATGEPLDMVFPLKGADGHFRPFLTRVNPLRDDDGNIVYWFGTNTDVSEITQMQEALRDADRRKDEFLATLAHELRNPLAPIRNALQILNMGGIDDQTAQQVRETLDRQVNQLIRLVDDLLDISRVMRGKIELRRQHVELASVVARAVETANPLIESQGHTLDISLPPDALYLDADPMRLAQVVANLLTNAAKYTNAKGHIWLKADRDGDREVMLSVKDSGIGIAPEILPHIFDLFVQADYSSVKSQGGLGIGLTLVKNLVEMHNGQVEARSDGLGQGSEFIVRLPMVGTRAASSSNSDDMDAQQTKAPSGFRLLVVDDNDDAAKTLAMLLGLLGHEVRIANDGPKALEIATHFRPDLVFLDIGMPRMDGYEVARRLREIPGLQQTVLAALTGWGQKEDRRRSADAGFNYHLVKPPEPRALNDVLATLNTSRQVRSSGPVQPQPTS